MPRWRSDGDAGGQLAAPAPLPRPPIPAAVGGIVRDPIDVRDRAYEPTLAPERLPPDALLAELRDEATVWGLPRNQGDEGTCGGQALAALIDLERIGAAVPERPPRSARGCSTSARG